MNIINYNHKTDLNKLAELYKKSILKLGIGYYNETQLKIWSSWTNNIKEFKERLTKGTVLVAEINNELVGFGHLHPSNYISLIYTNPIHKRKGIAKSIYLKLKSIAMSEGNKEIFTHSSKVARKFFESLGFKILEKETVNRENIDFLRFHMKKIL